MNQRNFARALYIGISVILVDYVGVMLLHASNRDEFLQASHVPGRFVPYVYYGSIAACSMLQILAAYSVSTNWQSSKPKRLLYTGLLLIGILIAVTASLKHIFGVWVPAMAYAVPQVLVILGSASSRRVAQV